MRDLLKALRGIALIGLGLGAFAAGAYFNLTYDFAVYPPVMRKLAFMLAMATIAAMLVYDWTHDTSH